MRFHFDYEDTSGITLDEDGIDLPDIEAARLVALRSLVEVIRSQRLSRAPSVTVNIRTDAGLVSACPRRWRSSHRMAEGPGPWP